MKQEKFPCPCCGYKTLDDKPDGTYNICPVCFWEDDGVQFSNPDYSGGANRVSLREAQRNFLKYGASEEKFLSNVRKPNKNEARDSNWKPLD